MVIGQNLFSDSAGRCSARIFILLRNSYPVSICRNSSACWVWSLVRYSRRQPRPAHLPLASHSHCPLPFRQEAPFRHHPLRAPHARHMRRAPGPNSNSNSNWHGPIWHRSQCFGVKWGRVRCACGQCQERRHGRAQVSGITGISGEFESY